MQVFIINDIKIIVMIMIIFQNYLTLIVEPYGDRIIDGIQHWNDDGQQNLKTISQFIRHLFTAPPLEEGSEEQEENVVIRSQPSLNLTFPHPSPLYSM